MFNIPTEKTIKRHKIYNFVFLVVLVVILINSALYSPNLRSQILVRAVLPLICCCLISFGLYKIHKFIKINGGFTNESYIWVILILFILFLAVDVIYGTAIILFDKKS